MMEAPAAEVGTNMELSVEKVDDAQVYAAGISNPTEPDKNYIRDSSSDSEHTKQRKKSSKKDKDKERGKSGEREKRLKDKDKDRDSSNSRYIAICK